MSDALRKTYFFLCHHAKLDFITEEDVSWAFGVLQTNAIGLPRGRALYPIVSLMSHSCVPNLTSMVNPGEAIAFKANKDIQENDEFTIRYRVCFFSSERSDQKS